MARKTSIVTISTRGRDIGKVFHITELSSAQSEEWATRALFVMMNCGVDIPDDLLSAGLAGIAAIGIKSLSRVPYEMAKPLFDEMWECIRIQPDPNIPNVIRALVESDIEEVSTRLTLRKAVLDLHLDFFRSAAPSQQEAAAAVAKI
ncbi:hypothetical protein [Paraburkholderia elongata]|uniref:Uncharacterized protein n=1 Tax=Paraburkholderia elongata TaxID=2675747 RepID=A0A972NSW8_9BURK|nr:hypothetical protein [Paraburkholderia elongata]NPT59106.1 hypothetical protein [Paraburkholderia elongata]